MKKKTKYLNFGLSRVLKVLKMLNLSHWTSSALIFHCFLRCSDTADWLAGVSSLSLSLRFNGHFPGEPGLAGVYWSKERRRWWSQLDYCSCKLCKAPVKSSPPTNQHPVLITGRMPFLSPNQQCQSTDGKNITFRGLAYPKLTWGSSNFVSDH